MPSTIGHLLGGVAAAWTADLFPGDRRWRSAPPAAPWYARAGSHLTLACAILGAAPDFDVLVTWHRGPSHSVLAVALAGLFGAALAANARRPIARVGAMCAAALGTHLVLDWLGVDRYPPRGIQLLWPFSREWFISGLDLFRATARQRVWTPASIRVNIAAVAQELAIMLPIVLLLWTLRAKAFARERDLSSGRGNASSPGRACREPHQYG